MENAATTDLSNPADGYLEGVAEVLRSVGGLITAGGNGLAAIIFVAVMLVIVTSLVFGSRMTKDMVGLTKWYLGLGTVCVALSLAVGVAERFLGATYDLYVSISPSLATVGYPDPIVRADAAVVKVDTKFPVSRSMGINVILDETIEFLKRKNEEVTVAVRQAEEAGAEAASLKQVLAAQSQQFDLVQAKFEALTAGSAGGDDLPTWANAQLEAIGDNLNEIKTSLPQEFYVQTDPRLRMDRGPQISRDIVDDGATDLPG
jgi:hypothetical protein